MVARALGEKRKGGGEGDQVSGLLPKAMVVIAFLSSTLYTIS